MAHCEPSFSVSWPGERHDLPSLGLLSRVTNVAFRSRAAFPPAEVSLEHDAALLASSQSSSPIGSCSRC